MAFLRTYQRVQALSTNWKVFTRLSSTKGPRQPGDEGDDGEYKLPYWFIDTGGEVKEFDQIPGPKFLPLIGHEWRYEPYMGIYDRERIHRTYAKMLKEYGPVVKEHIGKERTIVHVFHPEDIRLVYISDGKFPNRMSHRIMARYRAERPHLYDSPGLGPSNGEDWSKFRNEFVKFEGLYLIKGHTRDLEVVADDLVARVQSSLDKNGEVDVMPMLFRWTLEGIGVSTLKRRLGCLDVVPNPEADKLIEASHITNDVVYRTEMMSTGHQEQYERLVPAEDYFASVVRKYIDEAIAELPTRDNLFIRTIMNPETKKNDLYTFILDLFHAGIHSTAVTTAFALYHLALNRDVQEKLRRKLLEVLPTKDTRYVDSKTTQLDYLFQVIRETLRLNPPTIGNGRVLQVPLILGGYKVPESTMVLLHHQVASLQEGNFGDAHKFIPERFGRPQDGVDIDVLSKNLNASQPFGFGARQCVGQPLAREEMKLAIAKFVRNFEISYHHEKIDTVNRLHNEPDKPVKLRFRPLN